MRRKWISMILAVVMLLGLSVPAFAEGEPEVPPPAAVDEAPPTTDEAIPAGDTATEDTAIVDATTTEDTPVEDVDADDGFMTVSAAPVSIGGVTLTITGIVSGIKDYHFTSPDGRYCAVDQSSVSYGGGGSTTWDNVINTSSITTQISVAPGAEIVFDVNLDCELSVTGGTVTNDEFWDRYYNDGEFDVWRFVTVKAPSSGSMTVTVIGSDAIGPEVIPFTFYNEDSSIVVSGGEWGSSWRNTVTNADGTTQEVVTTGGEFALDIKNGYSIEVLKGGYVAETRAPEGPAYFPDCTEYVLHVDLGAEEFVISLVKNGEKAQTPDTTEPQIEAPPAEDTTAQTGGTFTDVASGVWYADTIQKAYSSGIVKGVTDTTFAPNGTTTRGQTVTMLYRAMGSPGGSNVFSDTTGEVGSAAGWASANGVTNGVSATAFSPNSSITREQLVTMLYRMAGSPPADTGKLASYSDGGSVQSYAQSAVAWAISNGLLTGYGDGTIRPAATASRAEVCTFIMRYLGAA